MAMVGCSTRSSFLLSSTSSARSGAQSPLAPSKSSHRAASQLLSHLRSARETPSALLAVIHRSRRLPKCPRLATLRQLLLDHDWQLALPMYLAIQEAPWYKWNAHLHAHIVAILVKFQQSDQAALLMLGLQEKLSPNGLATLYSILIEYFGAHGLKDKALATCLTLQGLSLPSADKLSFESLLRAFASMDSPKEAEEALREMQRRGYKPSKDEYKALLFSYGRCRLLEDMERIANEMQTLELIADPVPWNMILAAYAITEKHDKLEEWLGRMLATGVCLSVRSLNALVLACPVLGFLASMSGRDASCADALLNVLKMQGASSGELHTVKYLLEHCLLPEVVVWSCSYWLLDLHSMGAGAAYVVLLSWLKEVFFRLGSGENFPCEVIIVTGWGKHSEVRGNSSVKLLTVNLLASLKSPLRMDNQNKGRLLAKGLAVKAWLIQS